MTDIFICVNLWKELDSSGFFFIENYFIRPLTSILVARAFSSFSFENDRSLDATVTGNVRKLRKAEQTSAKFEDMH